MGAARGTSRHASSTEQLSTALLSPSPEAASAPQKCAVTKDTTYCSYLGSLVTKLNRVARMPFYELHKRCVELDRDTVYQLYCDKGVMSRLHAAHLLEQGYDNIKVYRPS